MENAGYRASERKAEFFLNETKWLGTKETNRDSIRIKKSKSSIGPKTPGKPKRNEILSRCYTIPRKFHTEIIGKNGETLWTFKERQEWNYGREQDEDFNNIK